MYLLVSIMLVTIFVSFVCSIMEAVLLSITPSYIGVLQGKDPALANRMQALKSKVDQPLAAILTLNTIAHTMGASGVGAQASILYGDAAVGFASAVMTLFILIFSEIIPKTLGATYWRQLAGVVCQLLVVLVPLLKPFVWISDQLTILLSRNKAEEAFIREELEAMAVIGAKHGELEQSESTIISSLLRFRKAKLTDVLTPRTVLFKVHKDMTVVEYLDKHGSEPFSRIPIFNTDKDDVVGYVLKNDIMLAFHRLGPDYRLSKLSKAMHTVSETIRLPELFNSFIDLRLHIALIVDEYGDVQGIVTLEDLLECLLGVNILDETDRTSDMRKQAITLWKQRVKQNKKLIDGTDLSP